MGKQAIAKAITAIQAKSGNAMYTIKSNIMAPITIYSNDDANEIYLILLGIKKS